MALSSSLASSAAVAARVHGGKLRQLRRWLRRPLAMTVLALLLRLVVISAGHTYKLNPRTDHFGFGWETGRIGRAIAEGEGFSSPFHGFTGPTAWVAPAYPFLVAGVFRVFGVYTYASGWVLLAINSMFSALTCWIIYLIAAETVGLRVARWAGWTWALLPYSMYWAIHWIWETSLSAFLLSVAFLLALRLARDAHWAHWAGAGALWAVIALTNPSLLSFLPFAFLWPAIKLLRAKGISVPGALRVLTVAGVVFLAGIAPWIVRNYRVFGQFIFIRSNFGAELRMGNSPQANGLWMDWLHPTQDPVEMAKYQRMGEIAYVHQRKQEAMGFIRANPGRFLWLCWRRFLFYWMGTPRPSKYAVLSGGRQALFTLSSLLTLAGLWLMVRHRITGALLFTALMLVYPLVYYLTFPHPRYRHPIEPEMVIAGLYLLAQAVPTRGLSDEPQS